MATWTIWIVSDSLSLAWSESSTFTCTFVAAGPSGKVQSKEPPEASVASESVSTLPPVPQSKARTLKSSTPGSVTVKEYVCVVPSLTSVSLSFAKVTVGATLLIVIPWLSESVPPSPSSTETLTSEPDATGPSSKAHLKLDAVFEPVTYAPGPQSTVIVSVSSSASLVVKLNVRSAAPDSLYVCYPHPR